MTQSFGEFKEITSLPGASSEDTKWIAERLEREKQKRGHRRVLFWGTMITSVVFFLTFLCMAGKTDLLCKLGESSPYCVWIIALLGVIPTFLLIGLMRGIYAKNNKEGETEEALRLADILLRESR